MATPGSSRLVLAGASLTTFALLLASGCEQQGGGPSSAGASASSPQSSLAERAVKSERPTSNPVQNGPRQAASTPKQSQGPSLSAVYANSLQVDAQHLVAADSARLSSCSGNDLARCRSALQQVSASANVLQGDLNAHPAPVCMKGADGMLRSAIDLFLQGAQLSIRGIDQGSSTDVTQGTGLLDQGTARLSAASSQLGQSSCSAPPPSVAP
jgi:hypothetical protein